MKKVFLILSLIVISMTSWALEIRSLPDYKDWIDEDYRTFAKGEDALAWGNSWTQGSIFSPEEQAIVLEYSRGSSIFNNDLRAGKKFENLNEKQKKKIKLLDQALNKFIIFEKIIVYRYERLTLLEKLLGQQTLYELVYSNGVFLPNAEQSLKALFSLPYTDFGFMSTTLIRNAVFAHRPIELVIKIPRYSDGLFIARTGFTVFLREYEILFPRNRTLDFEGFEISEDRKHLTIYAKMRGPLWIVQE